MYLLDTHTLIWTLFGNNKLSKVATDTILGNDIIFVSVASLWEIAIKSLPQIHRDPFDRLLIAQAKTENLTLITKDEIIRKYDIETLW